MARIRGKVHPVREISRNSNFVILVRPDSKNAIAERWLEKLSVIFQWVGVIPFGNAYCRITTVPAVSGVPPGMLAGNTLVKEGHSWSDPG